MLLKTGIRKSLYDPNGLWGLYFYLTLYVVVFFIFKFFLYKI